MIVGGYALDLYCDGSGQHEYEQDSASFHGWDRAQARRKARDAGWTLLSNGRAYCPRCGKPGRKKQSKD